MSGISHTNQDVFLPHTWRYITYLMGTTSIPIYLIKWDPEDKVYRVKK